MGAFPISYIVMNKSEARNPKSETNSKLEFKNVQKLKISAKYGFSVSII